MARCFLFLLGSWFLLVGCWEEKVSFSVLPQDEVFLQKSGRFGARVDILWVIDNSASMRNSQEALGDNFQSFISQFQKKNFDYKMAVTVTDAYQSFFDEFDEDESFSNFKYGTSATGHSHQPVITPKTEDLSNVFIANIQQGTEGNLDERAFQSIQATLLNQNNAGFIREDSFVAVIIVSDEDDFSHEASFFINDYDYSELHSIGKYLDFFDDFTGTTGTLRRYNVSAVSIWDQDCLDTLTSGDYPSRRIGRRYGEIVEATQGVRGDLCGDFSQALEDISMNILELASQFYLSRKPRPSTLSVTVDGELVPKLENPKQQTDGWYYSTSSNSIVFRGDAIPFQGSVIRVRYEALVLGE